MMEVLDSKFVLHDALIHVKIPTYQNLRPDETLHYDHVYCSTNPRYQPL